MPMSRNQLISLDATPHYHVVSRCVRFQVLCGVDVQTGRDFRHRRDWIRAWDFELAEVFANDLCALAVMSNHYWSPGSVSAVLAHRERLRPCDENDFLLKSVSAEIGLR